MWAIKCICCIFLVFSVSLWSKLFWVDWSDFFQKLWIDEELNLVWSYSLSLYMVFFVLSIAYFISFSSNIFKTRRNGSKITINTIIVALAIMITWRIAEIRGELWRFSSDQHLLFKAPNMESHRFTENISFWDILVDVWLFWLLNSIYWLFCRIFLMCCPLYS